MMKRWRSKVGAVLATAYTLLAAYVAYDAYKCTNPTFPLPCDFALGLVTLPAFLATTFLLALVGLREPGFSHASAPGPLDMAAFVVNILICAGLVYLLGLAAEKLLLALARRGRRV
ncbi:MAG: hypothetical protein ACRD68_18025 [Pyrinomonadaceae bacterium]